MRHLLWQKNYISINKQTEKQEECTGGSLPHSKIISMHPKYTHRPLRGTRLDNAKKSVGRPVKLAVLITQFNATEQLMNSTDYIGRATCVHLQYSTVLNCFITVKKWACCYLASWFIYLYTHLTMCTYSCSSAFFPMLSVHCTLCTTYIPQITCVWLWHIILKSFIICSLNQCITKACEAWNWTLIHVNHSSQ